MRRTEKQVRTGIIEKTPSADLHAVLDSVLEGSRLNGRNVLPLLAALIIAKWDACNGELELPAWDLPPEQHLEALSEALKRTSEHVSQRDCAANELLKFSSDIEFYVSLGIDEKTEIYQGILRWLRPLDFGTSADRQLAADTFEEALRLLAPDLRDDSDDWVNFITPEPVIDLMLELANPVPGERIYDPCFCVGGLLVGAAHRLHAAAFASSWRGDAWQAVISGVEADSFMYVIGQCRLLLAGIDSPRLDFTDRMPRSPSGERFDCILSAPPWSDSHLLEDAYLKHVMEHLSPGGRSVVALPEGLLFRAESSDLRKALLSDYRVDGIVSLPAGAFEPYTSIPVSLVLFSCAEPRSAVRFASVSPMAWDAIGPGGSPERDDSRSRNHGFVHEPDFESEVATVIVSDGSGAPLWRFSRRALFRDISGLIAHRREMSAGAVSPGVEVWEVPLSELALRDHELVPKKSGSKMLDSEIERLVGAEPSLKVERLERVAEVYGGLPYDGGVTTERRDRGDIVAGLLRAGDLIDEGTMIRPPSLFLTSAGKARTQERDFLRPGDLVITTAGTVGRIGFIEDVKGTVGVLAAANITLVRAREGIKPQFLAALLRSPAYRNWLSGHATGTAFRHLSLLVLRALKIPIPPKPEQEAMLAELAGTRADALAVLYRLLSGTASNPVAAWLETPLAAELAAGGAVGGSGGMDRLVEAAKGLRGIAVPTRVRTVTFGDDDMSICLWLEAAKDAAAALDDIVSIPSGSGRLAILQFALTRFHKALGALGEAEGRTIERLRSFTQAMTELAEREIHTMQRAITLDIGVDAADMVVGVTSEVRLWVTNASDVPLRNVRVTARPPDGADATGEFSYLADGETRDLAFAVRAQDATHPLPIAVSWRGHRLDGTPVQSTSHVSLPVRAAGETVVQGDLGASPYIVGSPVDRREMFFGRDDVMQQIERQLGDSDHANVILLEGNRRTGKTSILRQIGKTGSLGGWIPVYCSLQDAESVATEDCFRLLARCTGWSLYDAGVETWFPGLPARDPGKQFKLAFRSALAQAFVGGNAFETFRLYLSAAVEAAGPRRVLLMLDEFDKLQEGIDAGITSPQVPENIRHLLQHQPGVCAIITGSRRLKRLREEYWSALFGLGYRVGISALTEGDARRLVAEPVAGRLEYLPRARDRVVELCAGHPFLIQSLCSRVFDQMADGDDRTVTLDTIDQAATEMVRDNEHFRTLWDYAGCARRRLILALCDRLAEGSDPVNLGLLQMKLHDNGLPLRREGELADDITELRELELLEFDSAKRGGVYRLAVPLMAKWLLVNVDFDDLVARARDEAEIHP
ncbi:MAG: N-6 DNA methylase [Deltaproteobacteria bacterium]|nr:N-6 DNA methylase [Deltaproteobacteria bacterium]